MTAYSSDEIDFEIRPDGEVILRGMTSIPASQKWFWTEEWQAGETDATARIAAGDTTVFDSPAAFLAHLDQLGDDAEAGA